MLQEEFIKALAGEPPPQTQGLSTEFPSPCSAQVARQQVQGCLPQFYWRQRKLITDVSSVCKRDMKCLPKVMSECVQDGKADSPQLGDSKEACTALQPGLLSHPRVAERSRGFQVSDS